MLKLKLFAFRLFFDIRDSELRELYVLLSDALHESRERLLYAETGKDWQNAMSLLRRQNKLYELVRKLVFRHG